MLIQSALPPQPSLPVKTLLVKGSPPVHDRHLPSGLRFLEEEPFPKPNQNGDVNKSNLGVQPRVFDGWC